MFFVVIRIRLGRVGVVKGVSAFFLVAAGAMAVVALDMAPDGVREQANGLSAVEWAFVGVGRG